MELESMTVVPTRLAGCHWRLACQCRWTLRAMTAGAGNGARPAHTGPYWDKRAGEHDPALPLLTWPAVYDCIFSMIAWPISRVPTAVGSSRLGFMS